MLTYIYQIKSAFILIVFIVFANSIQLDAQEQKVFQNLNEVLLFTKETNYSFSNANLQTKLAELTRKTAIGNLINPRIASSMQLIDNTKQQEMAEKLAESQIGIVSTIPFGGLIMPIPTLLKYGVNVTTGNDSIIDQWNTFGTGSVLAKANLAAQLYGRSTEFELSRMLKLATAGPIPLDDNGSQQWPKTGDFANFVLIDASCSAEAVSRISPVKSLIHNGKVVF